MFEPGYRFSWPQVPVTVQTIIRVNKVLYIIIITWRLINWYWPPVPSAANQLIRQTLPCFDCSPLGKLSICHRLITSAYRKLSWALNTQCSNQNTFLSYCSTNMLIIIIVIIIVKFIIIGIIIINSLLIW